MRRNRSNLAARPLGRTALAIVLLAMGVMTGPAAGRAAETPAVATADCPPIAFTAGERQLIVATLLAADDPPPGVDAMDDPALMAALEWHAATQLGLRVRPSQVDRTWTLEPLRRDLVAEARCYRLTRSIAFVRAWAFEDGPDDPVAAAQGAYMLDSNGGRAIGANLKDKGPPA